MADTAPGAGDVVAGSLVAYRVLELEPRYDDRVGRSVHHRVPSDEADTFLDFTIGDVAPSLLDGLSNAIPVVDGLPAIRQTTEHANLPELTSDPSERIVKVPAFVDSEATYLTVAYTRRWRMVAIPDRWALWVADCEAAIAGLDAHSEAAEQVLDQVAARLVNTDLGIRRVAFASNRSYFEPDDADRRRTVSVARMTGTAEVRLTATGWEHLSRGHFVDALNLAARPRPGDLTIATPSWWYFQALNERDDLRRFLFAHWGLEALAAKFCKEHRESVARRMATDLGIPAKSLLWPTPERSDRPERNAEFYFALMSWALSPAEAEEDILSFRALASLRNRISHGERLDHASLPRHDGFLLLRKYLRGVAAYVQTPG